MTESRADTRFFIKNANSWNLKEIASFGECEICAPPLMDNKAVDNYTGEKSIVENVFIENVNTLSDAKRGDLTFFINKAYIAEFKATNSTACIVDAKDVEELSKVGPQNLWLLTSKNPYLSYAKIATKLYSKKENNVSPYIAPSSVIYASAKVDESCHIGHNAVIEENVVIGRGTIIEAGSVIKQGVIIGENCRIGSNVTISYSIIGNNVVIYNGAQIGQEGFGFAIDGSRFYSVPQLGRVIIGNNVEIGACSTIDRGAINDTVIGDGSRIDNLVQIGHNVSIGKSCIIVSQVGIAGSAIIDDFAILGGQVGINGHIRIGKKVQVGAKSGVAKSVEDGEIVMGYPARPIKEFQRQQAMLNIMLRKKEQ